ncbi:ATP-binding protein [Kitasatospora sp. DSM 101779]|uniref:ATP-binding protein n=1 Tax=Kitasatospora sp. DSM 101779 TaxID=2853165 RepID=UPI0021DAA9F5|nr:ATP-binding protein [Kitasatospora sp. DSM 101779]MCU7822815.1 ATP-binding protein [Kitasatospora sp. DSM 101779]
MGQPTGDFGQEGARPRTGEVVSGDLLLAVGGPDGSEARPCPDGWRPEPRRVRDRRQDRPELGPSPAVGPLAMGSAAADLPLLDREDDIARLVAALSEGRSIRLVGQAGSGRSTLLAAVADAAAGIAPDGVVRLSGHHRTGADLLQDLFAATHHAPGYRPDRRALASLLSQVGAVVAIDDLDVDDEELGELLDAAPDCAFIATVPPGSPLLTPGLRMEDHPVAGLAKSACLTLAGRLAGRQLDETERAWAVDLWFESEGLPLRFVQAAALLRQRDVSVDTLVAAQEDRHNVFGLVKEIADPDDPAVLEGELRRTVPLPTVAESAAPAVRLAEGLSESAQAVLRLALAFGGECPTAPHLPALIDVGLGESALRELVDAGLAVSVGGHHRLTTGVPELLAGRFDPGTVAYGAAEHFSWWVGHGSVTTEQISAEAEVLVGALLADRAADRPEAVLRLARAAAPALALSLRWGAWERVLKLGLEAARVLRATAEEAWFHHELGVLALCVHSDQRALAELESAVALRAAFGDPSSGAAGRRMLDLLKSEARQLPAGEELPSVGRRPVIRAIAKAPWRLAAAKKGSDAKRAAIAAAAAVVALGVLGTAIGLNAGGEDSAGTGRTSPGTSVDDSSLGDDLPATASGSPTAAPSDSPSESPSASVSASASESASASASTTGTRKPTATRTTAPAPGQTSKTPTTGTSTTTSPPPTSASPTSSASPSPTADPSGSPSTP